jgi:hypothetical protein
MRAVAPVSRPGPCRSADPCTPRWPRARRPAAAEHHHGCNMQGAEGFGTFYSSLTTISTHEIPCHGGTQHEMNDVDRARPHASTFHHRSPPQAGSTFEVIGQPRRQQRGGAGGRARSGGGGGMALVVAQGAAGPPTRREAAASFFACSFNMCKAIVGAGALGITAARWAAWFAFPRPSRPLLRPNRPASASAPPMPAAPAPSPPLIPDPPPTLHPPTPRTRHDGAAPRLPNAWLSPRHRPHSGGGPANLLVDGRDGRRHGGAPRRN